MTDDIKALRETAEAAKGINTDSFSLPTGQYKKLAAFYDLASPDRIARLLDRLEAAEKDAAMLDWLHSQYRIVLAANGQREDASVSWDVARGHWTDRWRTQSGATLRAAIDAAMQVRP